MPAARSESRGAWLAAWLLRAAGLFVLWSVLIGLKPVDAAAGALAALAAARLSLYLLPAGSLSVRPLALLALIPHFLWQSVVAGVDVARRAFAPRLQLRPGFALYRARLPRGARRNAFTAYTSLLPGTVPCVDTDEGIVYHCLDVDGPVTEELAREEQRIAALFTVPVKGGSSDD